MGSKCKAFDYILNKIFFNNIIEMFFLLEKKFSDYASIKYSVKEKADCFSMIIKYISENKIKSLVDENKFDPWNTGEGLHLVRSEKKPNEYIVYEVINNGYVRDYYSFCKVDRVNIVEFEITDKVDDADNMTVAMKELLLKNKK